MLWKHVVKIPPKLKLWKTIGSMSYCFFSSSGATLQLVLYYKLNLFLWQLVLPNSWYGSTLHLLFCFLELVLLYNWFYCYNAVSIIYSVNGIYLSCNCKRFPWYNASFTLICVLVANCTNYKTFHWYTTSMSIQKRNKTLSMTIY